MNTQELIDKLASKLGTTAEYLWQVLIHQAYIDGIISVGYLLICIVIWIVLWRVHLKFKGGYFIKERYEATLTTRGLIMVIPLIFNCLLSLTVICSSIPNMIVAFTNPEYWALKEVLSAIK